MALAELQPPTMEHLEAFTEYPWDDEESLNELQEAVIINSMDDNSSSGAPNNQAGVYSEFANDAALRFGVCFTNRHYKFSVKSMPCTIMILKLITKCSGELS
jgi:hypothetical protein